MKCGPDNCPITMWAELTPAEQRAKRKATAEKLYQQGFTMDAIAKQLGASKNTIHHDLANCSTVEQSKPAKTATNPKGAGRPKGSKKKEITEKHQKIVAAADAGTSKPAIAEQAGVGERMVGRVLEVETARRKTVEDLIGAAAAQKFSKSGALRIEDAIRIHKDRLNKAFEQKVDEEVRKRIAAADNATREQNKKLRQENLQLRQMMDKRGVFSDTQFNDLIKCIHPDNSASIATRNALLPFLLRNKQRLITSVH